MELTRIVEAGRQVIERYSASGFRVSGAIFLGPVLVFPDRTLDWPDGQVSIAGLAPVIEHGDIELFLLGLGRRVAPVAAGLRRELKAAGIAIEAMDTGAACRTYNLLIAEDRRVAAALLPPI
jgi:uncharacterized protein